MSDNGTSGEREGGARWRLIALLGGPVLAMLCLALLPETYAGPDGAPVTFTLAGRVTLSLMVWMGTWWLTEAIPLSATAMLPLCVLPLVTVGNGVSATKAMSSAAAPYAHWLIALFLGGFLVALSMERWGLHRRIALIGLSIFGAGTRRIVAGIMAVTALMSMWVSNTATAVMMLPIAMSIAALSRTSGPAEGEDQHAARLTRCMLLGIAYSASVGGIGTIIGTPPNTILVAFLESNYGMEIGFARWMLVGVPLVLVFLPIIWLLLTRVLEPVDAAPIAGGRAHIRGQRRSLGRASTGEWVTFVVFTLMAGTWMTRPLLQQIEIGSARPLAGLSDALIAVAGALLLFVIPVDRTLRTFVMDWKSASRLPWGILILFGGGLSLADAARRHGVGEYLASNAALMAGVPDVVVLVAVIAGVIFLTELTSNTATTATLMPVLAGIAPALGIDPTLLLVPAAIAASCAFMMPVATPPNAIVFGSGKLTIRQMAHAGLWLNLIGIVLVTVLAYTLVVRVLVG